MTSVYLAAFVGGAWLLQQQSVLPDPASCAILLALIVLWIVLARSSGSAARVLSHAVAIVTFACAGFFWAAAIAQWKLADELPEIWEGREVELSGVIAEMVQPNERGVRFVLDVERTYTLNARIPSHISLMWYENDRGPPPELRAGQRWRLTARLRRPHGNSHYGPAKNDAVLTSGARC